MSTIICENCGFTVDRLGYSSKICGNCGFSFMKPVGNNNLTGVKDSNTSYLNSAYSGYPPPLFVMNGGNGMPYYGQSNHHQQQQPQQQQQQQHRHQNLHNFHSNNHINQQHHLMNINSDKNNIGANGINDNGRSNLGAFDNSADSFASAEFDYFRFSRPHDFDRDIGISQQPFSDSKDLLHPVNASTDGPSGSRFSFALESHNVLGGGSENSSMFSTSHQSNIRPFDDASVLFQSLSDTPGALFSDDLLMSRDRTNPLGTQARIPSTFDAVSDPLNYNSINRLGFLSSSAPSTTTSSLLGFQSSMNSGNAISTDDSNGGDSYPLLSYPSLSESYARPGPQLASIGMMKDFESNNSNSNNSNSNNGSNTASLSREADKKEHISNGINNEMITQNSTNTSGNSSSSRAGPNTADDNSTLITDYMECPIGRVKLVIGHRGSLIKKLMQKTKTLINFHELDPNLVKANDGNDFALSQVVEIKGYSLAVANAKILIKNVIDFGPSILDDEKAIASILPGYNNGNGSAKFSNHHQQQQTERDSLAKEGGQSSYVMTCPSDKISIVIGSKGIIIKEIQKRSNALISIAEENIIDKSKSRQIEIKGTSSEISLAKSLINKVVQSGPGVLQLNGADGSGEGTLGGLGTGGQGSSGLGMKVTQELACPKDKVGAIIGSKGAVVRDLSKQTGATINVNEEHTTVPTSSIPFPIPGAGSTVEVRIIVVKGFPEEVSKAMLLIENILRSALNSESMVDNTDFEKTSGAALSIGGAGCIVGSTSSSSSAMKSSHVSSVLAPSASAVIVETLLCPIDKAGEIIGKRGVIVKHLRQESNAIIMLVDYPRSNLYKMIEVKGTADQCAKGKLLIYNLLSKNRQLSLESGSSSVSATANIVVYRKLVQFSIVDINLFRTQQKNVIKSLNMDPKQIEIYIENENTLEFLAPVEETISKAVLVLVKTLEELRSTDNNIIDNNNFPPLQASSSLSSSSSLLMPGEGDSLGEGVLGQSALPLPQPKTLAAAVQGKKANKLSVDGPISAKVHASLDSSIDTSSIHVKGRAIFSPTRQPVTYASTLASSSPSFQLSESLIGSADKLSGDDFDSELDDVDVVDDDDDDIEDNESLYEGSEEDYLNSVDGDMYSYDGAESDSDDDEGNDDDEIVHHTILCPNDKVGLIIGSKGIVIKSMMNRSKAKILVTADSLNGKTARFVEITGTEKQVRDATLMVECVIKHGQEALDQSGDASMALGIMTKYVDISEDQVRIIVGQKSSVMRSIIKDSKAGIVVSKDFAGVAAGKRRVLIKGTVEEVECALQLLRSVLNCPDLEAQNESSGGFEEGDNNGDNSDDSVERTLSSVADIAMVDASVDSKLGKAGLVKQLKPRKSKVASALSAHKDAQLTTSTFSKVGGGAGANNTLASASSTSSVGANANRSFLTKHCPLTRVGSLIGTRGSVIREIMKRTGTTIMVGDVPDPQSGIDYRDVTIRGSIAGVAEADKLIQGIIDVGTKILNGV